MRALLSLILRLAGVGGKFVAMLVLADVGGTTEVGHFALFFGAINVLLFAIGLDFHLFAIRELLARRTLAARARIVFGQATMNGAIYVAVLGISLILIISGAAALLPVPLVWFAAILVLDHLAQEFSRLFLILKRPHVANIIYAIKTGLWGWVGAGAIYVGWLGASADSFYLAWLVADILAILIGGSVALRMLSGVKTSLPKDYRMWIRRGLKVSRLFYLTSVTTMCLAYLDRFVIAELISVEQVGRYAFWQSITSLLPVVVYAMAGMHFLPRLVEASKRGKVQEFMQLRKSFLLQTIAISAVVTVPILVASPWVPLLLGKSEFAAGFLLVGLLTAAACMNTLWQVPYQVLYAANDDRKLAVTLTSATLLSLLLNLCLVGIFGITVAAAISVLTNGIVYVVLDRHARRHLPIDAQPHQTGAPAEAPSLSKQSSLPS